tara:strand:- start:389 stop:589 length:201 start_codon:yes stop_codon:yes gene_type:complete
MSFSESIKWFSGAELKFAKEQCIAEADTKNLHIVVDEINLRKQPQTMEEKFSVSKVFKYLRRNNRI